jgi:putative oxidoreductase
MGGSNSTSLHGWALAFLRVVVGAVFTMHGSHKFLSGFQNVAGTMHQVGIPFPMLAAVGVTMVEFFGGIALALGLFTRWAAILLAINMLVAVLKVHLWSGFSLPGGFEYHLTLLAACLVLAAGGPGAVAVDALRWKGKA